MYLTNAAARCPAESAGSEPKHTASEARRAKNKTVPAIVFYAQDSLFCGAGVVKIFLPEILLESY